MGKGLVREITLERMRRLFELAEKEFEKHPERSKRYVHLARELGKRNRVPIPRELKKRFCRKCGAYWAGEAKMKTKKAGTLEEFSCKECGCKRKYPA
ncbi:MAG: ribonuclease P [Candidatus Diapherotrites archaeon]